MIFLGGQGGLGGLRDLNGLLCDTWFTFPAFHSFWKSHFRYPDSDGRILGLITKL